MEQRKNDQMYAASSMLFGFVIFFLITMYEIHTNQLYDFFLSSALTALSGSFFYHRHYLYISNARKETTKG